MRAAAVAKASAEKRAAAAVRERAEPAQEVKADVMEVDAVSADAAVENATPEPPKKKGVTWRSTLEDVRFYDLVEGERDEKRRTCRRSGRRLTVSVALHQLSHSRPFSYLFRLDHCQKPFVIYSGKNTWVNGTSVTETASGLPKPLFSMQSLDQAAPTD